MQLLAFLSLYLFVVLSNYGPGLRDASEIISLGRIISLALRGNNCMILKCRDIIIPSITFMSTCIFKQLHFKFIRYHLKLLGWKMTQDTSII